MPTFTVETRLLLGKQFRSGYTGIKIDDYEITIIPAERPEYVSQALFRFKVEARSQEALLGFVHREVRILCDYFALLLNTEVHFEGLRINLTDCTLRVSPEERLNEQRSKYPEFFGLLVPESMEAFGRIFFFEEPLTTQFTRSCRMYAAALRFIPDEPEIAFLLLVSSIECLSSHNGIFPPIPATETELEEGLTARFVRFMEAFVPTADRRLERHDKKRFPELLKTAYRAQRSGFVHGGKEVSIAARMADDNNLPYFKNYRNLGKEVPAKKRKEAELTPGMRWLAYVCHTALVNFLRNTRSHRTNPDLQTITRIAQSQSLVGIRVKANRKTPLYQGKKFEMELDEIEHE